MPASGRSSIGFSIRRSKCVCLSWQCVPGAYAYEISFGPSRDRQYSSLLVYDANHYDLHGLNVDSPYSFSVRAVGETGVSPASAPRALP